ncbi:hypothetical protein [Actinoplanes utahensis]|uniref:Lipoprotein n=1 Tax=Actinoplanes utahensis TaxID=1869 RepID=A0A0A6UTS3_ACTUT|nr:hypothetical protein [Actinoplanes utahensis]KHD77834.1 hypothetical protein MB27_08555 [Actinoplanes utahensis]GIF32493.1 hypothetical protein Aut01nite_54790 [Actinoplanes utahensis]
MTRVPAVTALAFTAFLSGCAQAGSRPTAAPAAETLADSDGGRLLTEIVHKLNGTPKQRVAGQQRQYYAWQTALGACMTAKGATFEIPPPSEYVAGETVSVSNMLGWSMRYDDFKIAERRQAAAKAGTGDNPALLKLTGSAAERWLSIQYGCEPATRATEDLAVPAGAAAVKEKLAGELHALQKGQVPDLLNEYRTCMSGKGIAVEEGLPDVMMSAEQKYPIPSGNTDLTQVEGWAEAVGFEKAAAAADWECRGAKAARLIESNVDRLTVWAAAHKDELDAVAAEWAAMPGERDKAKAAATKLARHQ